MKKLIRNSTAEFLIFTTQTGERSIEVRVEDETVWLTQKRIAELFGKGRSTITEHLRNIFAEAELVEDSVCREFRHTGSDGKSYQTKFYNLDAIISIGYRVNSKRATQLRQWATQVLREFLVPTLQRGNAYHSVSSYRINGIAKSDMGSHGGPWEPEKKW